MDDFTYAERQTFAAILELAIREDLDKVGDLTGNVVVPSNLQGKAAFVARREGVLAGIPACLRIFERIDRAIQIKGMHPDGTCLERGWWIATVEGPMRSILAAERLALNFLQRLSGIATLTRQFVNAIQGTKARIFDTRKTIPGWRLLDKYAVRVGGGMNHRIGLFDAFLIKDNHLAAIRKESGITNDIETAIARCRVAFPKVPVEIEVDSLEQLDRALRCNPDIVLLDNMNLEQMRTANARRNEFSPAIQIEASGGVNLDTVRGIAETGVDRISVGALTHSAPALDIALDYLE